VQNNFKFDDELNKRLKYCIYKVANRILTCGAAIASVVAVVFMLEYK